MSATLRAEARPELPAPRSFVRPTLAGAALLWVYLGLAAAWWPRAEVAVAWALLGAYLVPATLVLESGRRLRRRDRLNTVVLLRTMLLGSLLAVAGSATPDIGAALAAAPLPIRATVGALPAVVETGVVAIAVALIGRRTAAAPRTGLFLGGAIGAGFAAFTALTATLQAVSALSGVPLPASAPVPVVLEGAVAVQQAMLAPITAPVWGALVGAAVFGSRRSLIATLAGVAATHLLADAAFSGTGGLLGTSPAALALQLLVTAVVAAPALAVWARRARALRHPGQRGGA
jgi:protease PrsW